jgi:hypothetical protein
MEIMNKLTANYWIAPKNFRNYRTTPITFTIYWITPNIFTAITTTPATDRELCFEHSCNRQSYATSSLDCIAGLGIDAACEAILLMHRTRLASGSSRVYRLLDR